MVNPTQSGLSIPLEDMATVSSNSATETDLSVVYVNDTTTEALDENSPHLRIRHCPDWCPKKRTWAIIILINTFLLANAVLVYGVSCTTQGGNKSHCLTTRDVNGNPTTVPVGSALILGGGLLNLGALFTIVYAKCIKSRAWL